MNFLVETKNEYTIQLINLLTPHFYEGFDSIYDEAKNIIRKGEEKKLLKTFQQFIKRIPSWNQHLIDTETDRIRTSCKCDFLENLLKAVIKANIILLSNSKKNMNIQKKYIDIPMNKFIHKCYIECARQFYSSPYLFYHEIKSIDKKRNQRDSYDLIKSSIKEAIRKILPVQDILNTYLGEKINMCEDEVDVPISNVESENLRKLVSKDLTENFEDNKSAIFKNENSIGVKEIIDKIDHQDNLSVNKLNESIKNNLIHTDNNNELNMDRQNMNNLSYSSIDDGETLNLLSEIKKTLLNNSNNLEKLSEIDSIVSEHINSINLEHKIDANNSVKSENYIDVNNNIKSEHNIDTNNILKSEHNVDTNNTIKSDNIKINYSENKVSQNLSKNKNIDSESSIAYIDNDENYEDVFSNIADTDSTNIDSIKNILNSDNEKAKNKSVYFSHLN